MIHQITVLPQFFHQVWTGSTRFIIKSNDANYRAGDTLEIREQEHGFFKGNSVLETIKDVYVSKPNPERKKSFVVIQI